MMRDEEVVPDYSEAGSGFPILMLPGMEGALQFWRYQLEGLSGKYRVISCELARFHFSKKRKVDDYARAVLRRMDSLGIDRAVIIGESFGGMVSQHLAINYPERLAALVLCNTMDAPRRGGFGLNVFTLACMVHNLAFLPGLGDARRKSILNFVGRHRGFVMDPSPGNDAFCDYILEYGTAHGAAAYLNRIVAGAKGNYNKRLGEIKTPTLVLRGTEDRLVGAETILQLVGRIPGAQLVLVEGGGHCCTYTMPEESNRAILAWLEGIDLGAAGV
jgi:pimeloyl-ACP methyl ester carboxylesterase